MNFSIMVKGCIFKIFLRAPPPDPRQGAAAPWTPSFAPSRTALACVRGCEVEKFSNFFFQRFPP